MSSKTENNNKGEIININNPSDIFVDNFITEYDTVRLELTDDSYVADISKIEFLDNMIYIWDYKQKVIFIFSEKGKFISKIDDKGDGPNQYISINGFEIDSKSKQIILSDTFSKRIFTYDKYGNQINTITLDFMPLKIVKQGDYYLNFYTGIRDLYNDNDMENHMVHFINTSGKYEYGEIYKGNSERLDIAPFRNISYLQNNDVLFQPALENKIFKISNGASSILYTLENNSDLRFFSDKEIKEAKLIVDKDNDLLDKEKKGYLIFSGNMINTDKYLILYAGYNKRTLICYSKTSKKEITITLDHLSGNDIQKSLLLTNPKSVYQNKIYIAVDYMFAKEIEDKINNDKLKTFFRNTKENDNPCIVAYKIGNF